jgi:AcrR family transcriptional regulator
MADQLKAQLTEQITKQATKQASKIVKKATDRIENLATQIDSYDVWMREAGPERRPRVTRREIAEAAIRIADSEGLDALSMRRLAAELDIGTMSIYHYLRTKSELLALVIDGIVAEILSPHDTRSPTQWRPAMTRIAERSRDSLLRHPWVLDVSDGSPLGPNALRHFDEKMRAVQSLDVSLEDKLDLIDAVQEFVIGYCWNVRGTLDRKTANSAPMLRYISDLFGGGDYPALQELADEHGVASTWRQVYDHAHDPKRFDRNLARLLDGFEADFAGRRRRKR